MATAPAIGKGLPRYVGAAATSTHDSSEYQARSVAEQLIGDKPAQAITPVSAEPQASMRDELSGGERLPENLRRRYEPALGHPLDAVRLHTGSDAAESAKSQAAKAYTLGSHIVFGENRYAPGTPSGARLLAHELTHVVQQARGGVALMRDPDPTLEALPQATRQNLKFDTDDVTPGSYRAHFGLAGDPVRADNVDETIDLNIAGVEALTDDKVKTDLRRGLRSYARSLFGLIPEEEGKNKGKALQPRLNLVHVENLDLSRLGGPDTAFRFACYGSSVGGKVKVDILVEQLAAAQTPMAVKPSDPKAAATANAAVETAKFNPYGLKRGDAIPDYVWDKVVRAAANLPESLLMRIRDVSFETSGDEVGPKGEAAEFVDQYASSAWTRRIVLYKKIQRADEASFAFTLAHELGHAIDAAPTQAASGRTAARYVNVDAGFVAAAAKDGGINKAITSYGGKSQAEFFAECLAMYVQQPATLKALRPNIHQWFVDFDAAALKDPKLNPHLPAGAP